MTQPILFIRLGALGDLMHLLPTLRAIHQKYPSAPLHLLTSPFYQDFLSHCDLPITLWTFQKGKHWLETLHNAKQVSKQIKQHFENCTEAPIQHIINEHPSLKTTLISGFILGWKKYRTHHHPYKKQKLTVTGTAERPTPRRHAVDDFYDTAQRALNLSNLGLPDLSPSERIPDLPIPSIEGSDCSRRRIGIIPGVGGKRPNRSWPLEHYRQWVLKLAHQLQVRQAETAFEWVIFGGPEEVTLASTLETQLRQALPHIHLTNGCHQWSLLQTAQHLKQCDVVIGGDTGPLHVAAAVGCGVIGLYAPTSVKRTGPVGTAEKIITLTPPDNLPCWPCEKPLCKKPVGVKSSHSTSCTDEIDVDLAVQAALQLLSTQT